MDSGFDPYHKWLGIPPKEQPPHHYRLLAINLFESDPDVISNAADRQMAHLRTFQSGAHAAESQRLLNEISTARIELLDPDKRAAYDRELKTRLRPPEGSSPAVKKAGAAGKTDKPAAAPATRRKQTRPASPVVVDQKAPTAASRHMIQARKRRSAPSAMVIGGLLGGVGLLTVIMLVVAFSGKNSNIAESRSAPKNVKDKPTSFADLPTGKPKQEPFGKAGMARPTPREKDTPGGPAQQPGFHPSFMEPLVVTSGQEPVDLLKLIDPTRDAVSGTWRMDRGVLITPQMPFARLRIPVRPQTEYRLTAMVERPKGGNTTFMMGLVMDGHQAAMAIDGWHGAAGLSLKGEPWKPQRDGRVITEPVNTLVYTVRHNELEITCNGEQVFHWTGPAEAWETVPQWQAGDASCLFIGAYNTVYRISRLEIEPLDGPAALVAGQPVDLLDALKKSPQALGDGFQLEERALVSLAKKSSISLPLAPPERYELTVEAARIGGKGALYLGIVVGGHQASLAVGGTHEPDLENATGLGQLDGKLFFQNETTFTQPLLEARDPHTLVCTVLPGSVKLVVDGRPIVDWRGDPARLSVADVHKPPDSTRLFLADWTAQYRITKLELRPLLPSAQPPSQPSGSPEPKPVAATSRHPVPADEALAAARQQMKETFRELYAKAAGREGKVELADALFSRAVQTADDPTARYAMLTEALGLAASAIELKLAMQVADEMAEHYEIDPAAARADALDAASRTAGSLELRMELALAAIDLIDPAIDADRYDAAQDYAEAAVAVAARTTDVEVKKLVRYHQGRIKDLQEAWEKLQPHREKLEQDPDDAAANLEVGRYRCFLLGDWQQGLPRLRKGSDDQLKELAALELKQPTATAAQVELGDGWWELADKTPLPARFVLQQHAAEWYQRAGDELSGSAKTRVESRLAKLETLRKTTGAPALKPRHPADAVAFGGHWYKVIDERCLWQQAKERCEELGGYLVCVETAQENLFVKNVALNDPALGGGRAAFWLGATDEGHEGVFIWVNGSRSTFADWTPGEPNNGGGTEHYVGMMPKGFRPPPLNLHWNDYKGGERFPFICEWER